MTITYSPAEDLLVGDMKFHDPNVKVRYLIGAAREINAALGSTYALPLDLAAIAAASPASIAYLEDTSTKIASGRLIMSMAVGDESGNVNAYGFSLLQEGLAQLMALRTGAVDLVGATPVESTIEDYRGPRVINYDEESAVDAFYSQMMRGEPWRWSPGPI